MKIGVLKERKRDERRVALLPSQAAELIGSGHSVYVESEAGELAGYDDDSFKKVGASVVAREEVYQSARMLLKVKCPLQEEYDYLDERHLLLSYLHFDENIPKNRIERIVGRGATCLAYEWVEEADGYFPILQPMSELSGAVFAQKSMGLLMEHKGMLGGYYPQWLQPTAMVIGAGHIGATAINVFLHNGFRLVIIDKHPDTMPERLHAYIDPVLIETGRIEIIPFDESESEKAISQLRDRLPMTDIVICAAVRRPTLPKERCEYLIRRIDLDLIAPGSVICDATACDRDFIESCVSTEGLDETYIEQGVVHYNCDHIPSLVARTATELLTEATFPYVRLLANREFEVAIYERPSLAKGVMCHRGKMTHALSALKKGMSWNDLESIL